MKNAVIKIQNSFIKFNHRLGNYANPKRERMNWNIDRSKSFRIQLKDREMEDMKEIKIHENENNQKEKLTKFSEWSSWKKRNGEWAKNIFKEIMNENLVLESLPVQVERHQSTDLVIQVYPNCLCICWWIFDNFYVLAIQIEFLWTLMY